MASTEPVIETPISKHDVNVKAANELATINADLSDLSTFQLERILLSDSKAKKICAVGKFRDIEGAAVVLLEKTPFDDKTFEVLRTETTSLVKTVINDCYGSYKCSVERGLNDVNALVIHPATDKHIQRFTLTPSHFVYETPDIYESITLPLLNEDQFPLDWVYNFLEHKAETERIVFEDDDPHVGFILAPDLKWDGIDLESLYLLAVVRPRGIKSLRDLTADHLGLLENVLKKGTDAIVSKYGIPGTQLRTFIHYQPTFYHLHIHFTYLAYDAPGIHCGRAHLLRSVINNIKLMPDYYQKATLSYTIREGERLFTKFCEKGLVQPVPKTETLEPKLEAGNEVRTE